MPNLTETIDGWVHEEATRLGSKVEERTDHEWRLTIGNVPLVIRHLAAEEALKFIVPFVPVPKAKRAEFFQMLLVRNLSVRFGAYAILKETVVFCDAIATQDLDRSEFIASMNSILDEVSHTLGFLREFGEKAAKLGNFEEKIGNFTFADDPAKRVEALEMLKFAVGLDGARNFLKSYQEIEGKPYLPSDRLAEILA